MIISKPQDETIVDIIRNGKLSEGCVYRIPDYRMLTTLICGWEASFAKT